MLICFLLLVVVINNIAVSYISDLVSAVLFSARFNVVTLNRIFALCPFMLWAYEANWYFVPGDNPAIWKWGASELVKLYTSILPLGNLRWVFSSEEEIISSSIRYTSRTKVSGWPPSKPGLHRVSTFSHVTFTALQLPNGSGALSFTTCQMFDNIT